jgi:hypothetical protein
VFPVVCTDKRVGIVEVIFIIFPRAVRNVLPEVPVGAAEFPPLAKAVSNALKPNRSKI